MIAVLDIGSNSVRLMLWADGKSVLKRVETTRLAEGLSAFGELSSEAIGRTVACLAKLSAEARQSGAEAVYAFATAAVRSSKNGGAFCKEVKARCGLDVDVVSGEEEALLALSGALGNDDGGVIDIGGASFEVCVRSGGKAVYSKSFPMGAVRLKTLCKDDIPLLKQTAEESVSELSGEWSSVRFCAVGGTATSLARLKLGLDCYDGEKIQGLPLFRKEVEGLVRTLLPLSVEERKKLRGMDAARADILAGGVLLLFQIMQKLNLDCVFASDRDNLEGYVMRRGLI